MNKQKLISALQSKLSGRRKLLKSGWFNYGDIHYKHDRRFCKNRMIDLGHEQKLDKQLLRQLIVDERELREIRDTMYNEY